MRKTPSIMNREQASLALAQKCSLASLGKPASTFAASFPAFHIFPVGTVPESSFRTETPCAPLTASHQCPLQSGLEVAAHWISVHYLKLQQEIPQLDQWKSFLTVRGIKQTFKGRKHRRRWDPPPTPAPFSCLTLCPWVRTQRKTQPALELWRWAVQSPCHGPSRRRRTLWTLWIAASHPLI